MTKQWKLVLPHSFNSLNGKSGGQDGALAAYEKISVGLELYDLKKDRNETQNVADSYPEIVEKLRVKADSIRLILGDKVTGVQGSEVRLQ